MPIVSNPTRGDMHVKAPLTNFSQMYMLKAEMFVAARAFPNTPVSKQANLYTVYNKGDFLRDEAEERSRVTESAGSGYRKSRDPYYCPVYAFHHDIADEDRVNDDAIPINIERSATDFITQKLLIRRERVFSNAFMGTGKWSTDVTGVSGAAGANQIQFWSEAGSDPIEQVASASTMIHEMSGYRPNKMIISRKGWDALKNNDAILSRIMGGATTSLPALVKKQLIAAEFEVDEILVMDAVFNDKLADATDPNADDIKFIGGKDALLYYAPNTVSPAEPTAGSQFSWTGMFGSSTNGSRVRMFRHELHNADRVEGDMAFDYKIVSPDLGYFFSGTVA